jgi:hypothetical protein
MALLDFMKPNLTPFFGGAVARRFLAYYDLETAGGEAGSMGFRVYRIPEGIVPNIVEMLLEAGAVVTREKVPESATRKGTVFIFACESSEKGKVRVIVDRAPEIYNDGLLAAVERWPTGLCKWRADHRLIRRLERVLRRYESSSA